MVIGLWDRMVDWLVARSCWLWGHDTLRFRHSRCVYCGKDLT